MTPMILMKIMLFSSKKRLETHVKLMHKSEIDLMQWFQEFVETQMCTHEILTAAI